MSRFFLNNPAIDVLDYNEFKNGLLELIAINKRPDHSFFKHETIYSLPIIINGLYNAGMGSDEQEIYRFLEQLIPCDSLIETELDANSYCKSEVNGFLGINFSASQISAPKKVINKETYYNWCFTFLSDITVLLTQTHVSPEDKKIHLSDHHGQKELKLFCDKIKKSPYVLEMQSTDWGGKRFIRKVKPNGIIEIVLYKTEKQYALNVKTTGNNLLESRAIANILKDKYDD